VELCKFCYKILKTGWIGNKCVVCCNIFEKIPEMVSEIVSKLSEIEFDTFQVGARSRGSFRAMQEYLEFLGIENTIKKEFNSMVASELSSKLGKELSQTPDVKILFDLEDMNWKIEIRPVYIFGRYIKRIRNISQTRWLCRNCMGRGCQLCDFRGKKYVASVEELIAKPMVEVFGARDGILHGAGREDVDARMLGTGRPFIIELIDPMRRRVDLQELQDKVNESCKPKVEVRDLRYAEAREIRRIKGERFRKLYRVKVVFDSEIEEETLKKAIEGLSHREIRQRTPKRVEHRRSDRVRVRKTYRIRSLVFKRDVAVLEVEAEAGLYIKELISGDDGRTQPNLASLVGCGAWVEKLDVIAVY
jgi:tRNA pseudouridine synthase 10